MKSFGSSLDVSKKSVLTTIRMVSGVFRGDLCRSPSPTSDANSLKYVWNSYAAFKGLRVNMCLRVAGSIYCIYSITEQKYNFNQLLFHSFSFYSIQFLWHYSVCKSDDQNRSLKTFFWLDSFVIFWMSIDGYKWQTSQIVILTLNFTDFMSVTTAVCKYLVQSLVL